MVLIDLTHRPSLASAKDWIRRFRTHQRNKDVEVPLLIVGNKKDLKGREVSEQECKELAGEHNAEWALVSAKTGEGVEEAWRLLVGNKI